MHTAQRLIALSAIALLGSGAAFAQEATSDAWMQIASSGTSRAAVVAELHTTRQTVLTDAWSLGYIEPLRQSALRATVKAETLQAIASGELAAINARVPGNIPVSRVVLSQAAR